MGQWTNPYITLAQSKPHYLLPCLDGAPAPDEVAVLEEKMGAFQRRCCELCSGSGRHILSLAERNRDTLFIGFEIRFKRAYRAALQAERNALSNIVILRCDARLIGNILSPASLAGIYINFPDPWEKRRLAKHLLLTPEYLQTLNVLLQPGGFFSYKTDHQARFEKTMRDIRSNNGFHITKETRDLNDSPFAAGNVCTEFEGFFRGRGIKICLLEAEKR